jgi:hypothetical protein
MRMIMTRTREGGRDGGKGRVGRKSMKRANMQFSLL